MVLVGAGMGADGHWSFHFHNPISGVFEGDPHAGLGHSISHVLGDTLGSFVLAPTKWLNLRSVPLLVWMGVFTLTWWSISVICWMSLDEWLIVNPGRTMTGLLIVRNLTFALPLTKAITQPMIGWFADTGQSGFEIVDRCRSGNLLVRCHARKRSSEIQNRCGTSPFERAYRRSASDQRYTSLDNALRLEQTSLSCIANNN